MDMAIRKNELTVQEIEALDTLFSLLDKGIDDVESGNVYTFEESFKILEEA